MKLKAFYVFYGDTFDTLIAAGPVTPEDLIEEIKCYYLEKGKEPPSVSEVQRAYARWIPYGPYSDTPHGVYIEYPCKPGRGAFPILWVDFNRKE